MWRARALFSLLENNNYNMGPLAREVVVFSLGYYKRMARRHIGRPLLLLSKLNAS